MSKKILLVDDDEVLCEDLAEILRDEGYDVDNTFNSQEGMILIMKNHYDACLLDYKMEGLVGTDLLKKIKEKDPLCPVLMVSGKSFLDKTLQEENLSYLVAGIVTKPFNPEVLLKKLKELCDSPQPDNPDEAPKN